MLLDYNASKKSYEAGFDDRKSGLPISHDKDNDAFYLQGYATASICIEDGFMEEANHVHAQ